MQLSDATLLPARRLARRLPPEEVEHLLDKAFNRSKESLILYYTHIDRTDQQQAEGLPGIGALYDAANELARHLGWAVLWHVLYEEGL